MKKERVTRWFVEPRDARTNENAMMDLAAETGATDDKVYRAKLDNEGEGHDVVEVDRSFVVRMEIALQVFSTASECSLKGRVKAR